jgi:hypothetical protein
MKVLSILWGREYIVGVFESIRSLMELLLFHIRNSQMIELTMLLLKPLFMNHKTFEYHWAN